MTLNEMFIDYKFFCNYYSIQPISKKMFSIFLKELLTDDILDGKVGTVNTGKLLFKGVHIKLGLEHHKPLEK